MPDPAVPHLFDMNPIPAERGIYDRCRCGKEILDPIHAPPVLPPALACPHCGETLARMTVYDGGVVVVETAEVATVEGRHWCPSFDHDPPAPRRSMMGAGAEARTSPLEPTDFDPPGSCSGCAHFEPDDPDGYEYPFGQCRRAPGSARKRDDEAAVAGDDDSLWPDWTDGQWMLAAHPGVTAYTTDASSYESTLYVHPDHSCPMWEPAP